MENKETKNSKEIEKTEEEKDKVEELEETLPKKKIYMKDTNKIYQFQNLQ